MRSGPITRSTRARRWITALIAVSAAGLSLVACHRPTLVEGVVWFDADLDLIQDPDEELAAGVTVRVLCQYTDPQVFTDGECDTATTDGDGRYELFVRVDPNGETRGAVSFEPPAGFQAETPPDVAWFFSFPHSQQRDLQGVNAALVSTDAGSVGDRVWQDDGDGTQEAGEPGVAGIPVELQVGLGEVVASAVTDADGRYVFEAMPAGRYTVRFGPLPAGLRFSPDGLGPADDDSDADPYSGRAEALIEGGRSLTDIDAGLVIAQPGELGQIGDFVWTDLDEDGVQDAGEPGEAGVEVLLVGAATGQLSITVTDANGRYGFLVSRAIAPDQPYRLVFAPPPSRRFSPPDAGGDDTLDSDATVSGSTTDFNLDSDEVDNTLDAGIVPPGASSSGIGDFVWNDVDVDGLQDQGERGVADVTVTLIDASDAVVATTATDAAGRYVFAALDPADYRVRFERPTGFEFTAPDQGADDEEDSDVDPVTGQSPLVALVPFDFDLSVDAGLQPVSTGGASIGDFAWNDTDRDGIQDAGEPGIANVTVNLIDSTDTVVATTTTDNGGVYGFTNLAPGVYRLRFVVPAGLQTTVADAGSDDTIDSDVNPFGQSPVFTLVAGQVDTTIDAAFAILA